MMTSHNVPTSRWRRLLAMLRVPILYCLILSGILGAVTVGAIVWWLAEDTYNVDKVEGFPPVPAPGQVRQERAYHSITSWITFSALAYWLAGEGLVAFALWHAYQRTKPRRLAIKTGPLAEPPGKQKAICPNCQYDLRASPIRCPECGWSSCITLETWRWIMKAGNNPRHKPPVPAGSDTLLAMHKVFMGKR